MAAYGSHRSVRLISPSQRERSKCFVDDRFTTGAEPSTSLYTNTFSPVQQGIPSKHLAGLYSARLMGSLAGGVSPSASANTTGEKGNTPSKSYIVQTKAILICSKQLSRLS